ncbi:hypothetical protein [Granulosicoccus antarcticus]|uniref:Tetratricopeptide repeat protein n=1 Tax=Granulosicoccus antarcticus IMCC3135 TaxID=1192854 RepID=A0A2Z2P650_9GAMM|nr:hypothetical protein [Granulosicoccus antarcticus]ASJ75324.1 hypothetical protein IMCC3135_26345 [Granulosicoccus antarcticus IMCC3135]
MSALLVSGWQLSAPVHAQTATSSDTVVEPMPRGQCLVELDATVSLSTNETVRNLAAVTAAGSIAATIDRPTIDARLAELETLCPDMPQLAHNRGVLAARTNRWPEAIAHFERSLQMDNRAADTYRHLQEIYEHEAAVAYAKALDSPVNVPEPILNWQDSGDLNADANKAGALVDSLQSVSTVEYELFAWWNALRDEDGLKEHYVDDFPAAAIQRSRQFFATGKWENIQREIAFTASDAVVILKDNRQNRTLLLLRMVGTRWKIYQETRL